MIYFLLVFLLLAAPVSCNADMGSVSPIDSRFEDAKVHNMIDLDEVSMIIEAENNKAKNVRLEDFTLTALKYNCNNSTRDNFVLLISSEENSTGQVSISTEQCKKCLEWLCSFTRGP